MVRKKIYLLVLLAQTMLPAVAQPQVSPQNLVQPISQCREGHLQQDLRIFKQPYIRTTTGPSSSQRHRLTHGLTFQQTGYEMDFKLEALPMTDKGFCLHIKRVVVRAGVDAPKVWIKPTLRRGSCFYNVVLKHEEQHVLHFHEYIDEFAAGVRHTLTRFNNKLRVSDHSQIQNGFETMAALIKADIASIHERSVRNMNRKDADIDTAAEYRRLANICP